MAISASFSPVAFCDAMMRSRYFLVSRNFSGSLGSMLAQCSCAEPGSSNASRRRRASMVWW